MLSYAVQVIIRSSALRAYEFACHSAACRPPTSGGTGGSNPGPRPTPVHGGAKAWWRMQGGSSGITTAAYEMTGEGTVEDRDQGYGDHRIGKDERELARHILDSIETQPVRHSPMYSGHVLDRVPEVGEDIKIPLMALAHSRGLAEAYAEVQHEAGYKHPMTEAKAKNVLKALNTTWETAEPYVKELIGKLSGRRAVRRNERQQVVYEFESSKSSLIAAGKERVTSGRYQVTAVERKPIKGYWKWHPDELDFVQATYAVVKLKYVEPLPVRVVLDE